MGTTMIQYSRPCISLTRTNEAIISPRRGKLCDSSLCVEHWGQNGHLGFIETVLKVSWVMNPDGKQG